VANSPALFLIGFGLLFAALVASSWAFGRAARREGLEPDDL